MKKFLLYCFAFTLFSFDAWGSKLDKSSVDIAQADYYLLDVYDGRSVAIKAIDVYILGGQEYIAIAPLLEGLGLNYQLQNNKYIIKLNDNEIEIELVDSLTPSGKWFYDGFNHFMDIREFEKVFDTKVNLDLRALRASLSGHEIPFPHLLVKKNNKQRKERNVSFQQKEKEQEESRFAITVPDSYSLINVPNGRYRIGLDQSNTSSSYDIEVETVGDLAFHSASMLLNTNDSGTSSRLTFSRYPSEPDEKIFGLWDRYSFGDVITSNFTSTASSRINRGIGFSASSNFSGEVSQNMRTSFVMYANPGWEADIFKNGVYFETRVVPEDGVIEFNDVELNYGNNEFKLKLFGPYGEEDEKTKRIQMDRNPLSKGGFSYNFSLLERQSSLFDINLSEFNIDQAAINLNYGVTDYWNSGVSSTFTRNLLDDSIQPQASLYNRLSLPGWLFDNTIFFNESSITQRSSIATSIFEGDSLVIDFQNNLKTNGDNEDSHNFLASYNFYTNQFNHSLFYRDEQTNERQQTLGYLIRGNVKGLSFFNRLSYGKFGERETLDGSFNLSARIFDRFRLTGTIPYDLKAEDVLNEDAITLVLNYNHRTESNGQHRLTLSHRPLSEQGTWGAGYNYAATFPSFRLLSRVRYDSGNNWQISAGIEGNFGYDYFKNQFVFDSTNLIQNGSLNIHAYLDRHLNGVPDILDYSLEGVEIEGGRGKRNYITNEKGRVRAIGNVSGVTALKTSWKQGAKTINNDYLIYSHPGGNQNINLPFYLTTELELFTLLDMKGEQITWQNVPIIARNMSTEDIYTINSDFDGYVNLTDLLPGSYQVVVDPKYLLEKGYTSETPGFTFDTPPRGGFVILPNIVLTRELETDKKIGEIQHITLNDENYIPLFESDDDRLVHLPPKGAFTVPHTQENIQNAEFKRVNKQINESRRKSLSNFVAELKQDNKLTKLGLKSFGKRTVQGKRKLLNDFVDELKKGRTLKELGLSSSNMNIQANSASSVQVFAADKLDLDTAVVSTDNNSHPVGPSNNQTNLAPKDAWVVQYLASESFDSAINAAEKYYSDIDFLQMSQKSVNGRDLFVLTSQQFPTEAAALAFKNTLTADGFIVNADKFSKSLWSKQ